MPKLNFEKSNLPIIPVGLFLIVFIAILSIFFIIKSYSYHFSVKGFNYPLENIKLTFETGKRFHQNAYLVCFDDFCKSPLTNEFRSYYFSEFNSDEIEFHEKKVNKVYFAVDKDIKDGFQDIKDININTGYKNKYLNYDEIQKLEKKELKVNLKNEQGKEEIKEYSAVLVSDISNYRGFFSHLANIILSLFYNWRFFIIPYGWLFIAGIIFILNRKEFNFKFNKNKKNYYLIFGLILFLGIFLRLVDITYFPLWTDEVYTKQVAINNFASCFKDAGNPPLFFVLEYLFTKIFSTSLFALRFLPFVFGILFIIYGFILSKDIFKNSNDKLPLFALFIAFLASFDTVNIYHSQEARGYSLCMFLVVAGIYYLFSYLRKPTNKRLAVFSIFNILIINTNYYLILFSIANYIWGIVDLAQNKNKKEIIKFTSAQIICFLTIIPYLILSSKEALSGGFNSWIPKIGKETFLYTINEFFINKYVFLALCLIVLFNLIVLYLPKNFLEKINIKISSKKENLYLYLIYTLAFIIISACFISIFIKPIFHKRVLLSIYSLLFLLEGVTIASVIEFIKENKFIKSLKYIYFVALTLCYFTITSPMPVRAIYNISDFMTFVKNDINQYDESYEIHLITTDTKDYLKEYPEILNNKRIKFHFLDTNSGMIINEIKRNDYLKGEKGVIYFNAIGVNIENISKFNPALRLYKNNSALSAKMVY